MSLLIGLVVASVACGSPAPANNPRVRMKETVEPPSSERPSTVTTAKEEPKHDPFVATSGPGDAPVAYVRDERSSRLDVPLPKGQLREQWRAPLGPPRRLPCRGLCPPLQASFVLAAGNRVAVAGAEAWVLFDTSGQRVDAGKIASGSVRLDRVSGLIVPDDTRSADLPADAKVAAKSGLVVMVKGGAVHVGERAIEGRFDAFDVAIDETGLACVVVRQADDLLLWTVPLSSSASIGRQRIPGTARRALGPPVLGKTLRVFLVETGLVALGLDGKRVWEHRGVPTGGVSITSDDQTLVADNGKVLSIDPRGKVAELHAAKELVFVTPPILNAAGTVFVASGDSLHALAAF